MKSFNITIFFVVFFNLIVNPQTVTGTIIAQDRYGVPNLKVQLYAGTNTYLTTTTSDGSFIFSNVTSIKESELPSGYNISNNYPNPFNPKTRIEITLPKTSNVRIEVFNITGQRVGSVIEKEYDAGTQAVELEMNGLSNGVYFVRFTIDNNHVAIRKIMLLYGSNHLNTTSSTLTTSLRKVNSSVELDSIVVTGVILPKHVFTSLPQLNDTTVDIGNLSVNLFRERCPNLLTIEYGGKTYNTVLIGSQCWLSENLNVGTMIQGTHNQSNNNIIEKYCYNNDLANCNIYGGLYLWNEAMQYSTLPRTKGICPTGWYIPTFTELQSLVSAAGNNGNTLKAVGQGTGNGAGSNTIGFSALLAGFCSYTGYFGNLNGNAVFWSSKESNAYNSVSLQLHSNNSNITFFSSDKSYGFSVRCIKNPGIPPSLPTLLSPSNNSVNISILPILSWNRDSIATSYTLQVSTNSNFTSFIYNQSGLVNTSQQISGLNTLTQYYWRVRSSNIYGTSEWSEMWNFTTAGGIPSSPILILPENNALGQSIHPTFSWISSGATIYTLQVSINSNFTSFVYNQSGLTNTNQQISGLEYNTTYFWRVRATNGYGSSNWSDVWSFTTHPDIICGEQITYSGKTYNTVLIGNQCWLKENLDVGTLINVSQNGTNNGIIEKYCFNNDPANCELYGGYYQWYEAMQYSTTPGTQGICPNGWHIPTLAELQTLASTVGNNGNALKAIGQGVGGGAGTNLSGFSALLAGMRSYVGNFGGLDISGYFWSSTEHLSSTAKFLRLSNNDSIITFNDYEKYGGFSVRCIKD